MRSIAIFCACLALSFGIEIVVFSPARRASRKLLERIVEWAPALLNPPSSHHQKKPHHSFDWNAPCVRARRFVRLAGGDAKICEYNQEACRLNAFDGKKSLIRSFPSKVGVRADARSNPGETGETHTYTTTRRGEVKTALKDFFLKRTNTCKMSRIDALPVELQAHIYAFDLARNRLPEFADWRRRTQWHLEDQQSKQRLSMDLVALCEILGMPWRTRDDKPSSLKLSRMFGYLCQVPVQSVDPKRRAASKRWKTCLNELDLCVSDETLVRVSHQTPHPGFLRC